MSKRNQSINNGVFFSVIIPVYNVEKYLEECLDSVFDQNYSVFEVICVNDASTDNSDAILREYELREPRLRVYRNTTNRGLSYSRNIGLKNAKGDYVWFVDSDDRIESGSLRLLNEYICKYQNTDIISFGFKTIDEEGRILNMKCRTESASFPENVVTGKRFMAIANPLEAFSAAWQMCIRTDFLIQKEIKFKEGILSEELLFFIECLLSAESIIFEPTLLYVYRKRKGSITTQPSIRYLESYVIVIGEIFVWWKTVKLQDDESETLGRYIGAILAQMRRMILLFPDYNELQVGSYADKFLFPMLREKCMSMYRYIEISEDVIEIIKRYDSVYVYGAGAVAAEAWCLLSENVISIDGFVVSNKDNNPEKMARLKIYQIDELINERDKVLIVVALLDSNASRTNVLHKLDEMGFRNVVSLNAHY